MIPVKISEDALKFIKEKVEETGIDTLVISFEGFGWGGPKFNISLKTPGKGDELIYDGEFKIYLDKIGRQFLNEIDLTLKKSLFYGKYLALKNAGRRLC